MTTDQINTVKQSWYHITMLDQAVAGELFYTRLFEIAPEVKPMFRSPVPEQSKKLMAMISYVISKLDSLDDILDEVTRLAQRHVQYGVKNEHYHAVGEALLWTLEQGMGSRWNSTVKDSWTACYTLLSSTMIKASSTARTA